MTLVGTKVVAMVLTGLVPIVLGLIPWKVGKYVDARNTRHQITVSCLLCYGGGILIGLSLLHMLPEVRESLEAAFEGEENLAEIFVCLGFFMIYFIEEFVHSTCDRKISAEHCEEEDHTKAVQVHKAFSARKRSCAATENGEKIEEVSSDESHHQDSSLHQDLLATEKKAASTVRDFLTVLALSLHAVFEGLAVGLGSSTTEVWTLYAAVAMHKYVLSFCVGLELFTGKQNKFWINFCYILLYAIMSPIGIAIGIVVTESADDATTGILSGLAAGTLVYVAMFEIIQREKTKEKVPGLAQLLFILLGFGTILLFTRYGPDV